MGIVAIGQFNPVIYHPQWLARKDIIRSREAETATVKISHSEVSEFELEYCFIQVLKDRFTVSSTQETHFKKVRDLVRSIFDFLPECPIAQLGINLHHHYRFASESDYVSFGHKIVPKDQLWNSFLVEPGLSNLVVKASREDAYDGYKQIHVNVSSKVRPNGIQIFVNDHYALHHMNEINNADSQAASTMLDEEFAQSLQNSGKIIEGIYKYGIS